MFSGFIAFLKENLVTLQYAALTFIGALISHFKTYEASQEERTKRWHIYNFGVKLIYAIFVTMLIYIASSYFKWETQISLFLNGICCVFADKVIDLLWQAVKKRFTSTTGIAEEKDGIK